jgi:hypothetical protein
MQLHGSLCQIVVDVFVMAKSDGLLTTASVDRSSTPINRAPLTCETVDRAEAHRPTWPTELNFKRELLLSELRTAT